MCELFGASMKKPFKINSYLKKFYSHSTEHPHGWGLACIDNDYVEIEKEPISAMRSNYLKYRLRADVTAPVVLAHIRYATIGHIKYENCHPYMGTDAHGRRWTLIHNGTIFDYPMLNSYRAVQSGDTDSERILLHMIDNINKNHAISAQSRIETIEQTVNKMAKGNKLNLIMYDGEQLYVHTNYRNSLHYLELDGGILFSTLPLDDDNWISVPFTQLQVYKDSELIYTGRNHGYEYEDNVEDMKYLYQIFANL